jgi:N-acetyl-1-D-myo-inositol-2-amino-2-deoxy-alpha-D-glucopyranoside deacetylase
MCQLGLVPGTPAPRGCTCRGVAAGTGRPHRATVPAARARLPWSGLSVLFVHAHPDDEASGTALTAAVAAQRGAETTLVCLTTGDRGAVVNPALRARVASGQPSPAAELRRLRAAELRRSTRLLGFTHVVEFGYGDSGMPGSDDNARPSCLWERWRSGDPRPLARLVRVLRGLRPQVVVTYDANGGYGHPDHIVAHRLTAEAIRAAADPAYLAAVGEPSNGPRDGRPHQVAKLYHTCMPASVGDRVSREADRAGLDLASIPSARPYFGATVPDDHVTTVVEGAHVLFLKRAALRAHRSQISPDFPYLWNLAQHPWLRVIAGREHLRLAATWRPVGSSPTGSYREAHLFTGLESGTHRGPGHGSP